MENSSMDKDQNSSNCKRTIPVSEQYRNQLPVATYFTKYLRCRVLWQSTFINHLNKWYRKSSQAAGLEYPRFCDCVQFYQPSHRPLLPAVPFRVHREQLVFRGRQSTFDSIGGTTQSENHFWTTTAVRLLAKLFLIWSLFLLTNFVCHFQRQVQRPCTVATQSLLLIQANRQEIKYAVVQFKLSSCKETQLMYFFMLGGETGKLIGFLWG